MVFTFNRANIYLLFVRENLSLTISFNNDTTVIQLQKELVAAR
jgi:hypothetical protein